MIINNKKLPQTVLNYVLYPHSDHLEIEHDGTANWADLQIVKNLVWGEDAVAIEMYPAQSRVVNGSSTEFHYRHLWRVPAWANLPNIRKELL